MQIEEFKAGERAPDVSDGFSTVRNEEELESIHEQRDGKSLQGKALGAALGSSPGHRQQKLSILESITMQSSARGGYSPGKGPFARPYDSPASVYNHTLLFGPAKKNHAFKIK